MLISLQQYRGIRPAVDPELLPTEEAQIAQNAKIRKGLLRPWDQVVKEDSLVQRALVRAIELYESIHWLEWDADVDVVKSPLAGDTASKFYFTGDGMPKKSNLTLATTGSGAKPISMYPLALPSPKPAAVAGAPGAGGAGDARDVNYVWTLVSNWGEESVPSPASNTVAPTQGQQVDLTAMSHVWAAGTTYTVNEMVIPTAANGYLYKCIVAGTTSSAEPTWGTTIDGNTTDNTVTWRCYPDNMSYKRIYRLNVGTEFAEYLYLTQLAAAVTTYSDTTVDADLGEVMVTTDYDPPPDGLSSITYMGNGIMSGFLGKDVYFTEPWQFHAWPIKYILTIPPTVVGLGAVAGGTLVAATVGKPYIFTGVDPGSISHAPLPEIVPCLSKRGIASAIVDTQQGSRGQVIFPSPFGLYMVDGATGTLLTRGKLDKATFAAYYPATMHGVISDNYYFGFYSYGTDEGCLVVDLLTGDVTTLSLYADAAYVDPQTDALYYVKGTNEVILQEDGTSYPSRTNAILQEDGVSYILRE
jgi:hypothetical protein